MKSNCHFEKLNECLRGISTATVLERVKTIFPPALPA
jgi:hypothetical protein